MARFRPGIALTLCVLPALSIMLALGVWQLERRAWKLELIAQTEARLTQPAIALPADPAGLEDPRYLPVFAEGEFLHGKEFYLASRTYNGRVGFHVVTPFKLTDGRVLLVDRGWVPPERKQPESRPEGLPEGPRRVEGLLRREGWTGWSFFEPVNDVEGNAWVWVDAPAMAAAAGLDEVVTGVYLAAGAGQHPGDYPRGGVTIVSFRNDHLQYAITWFSLAAILLIIYFLMGRRRGGA